MNLSLKNIAEEYFSSLNPIAERISIDVAATKNAYEDLWHTLNLNDQCQVINETIIHPEVMLKYSFHLKDTPEVEYFTHKLDTQEKYVGDDEGGKGSANQHLAFRCCGMFNWKITKTFSTIWYAGEVSQKLHNLSTQLNNELRKIRKRKSEQGSGELYTSKWDFFESLQFKQSSSNCTETQSNFESHE